MTRREFVLVVGLSISALFSLPIYAMGPVAPETVRGKVTSLDKDAKKIKIGDNEYALGDEVVSVEIGVGDEVEADIANNVVKSIKKVTP